MAISDRIKQLSECRKKEALTADVEYRTYEVDGPEINQALNRADEEERFTLAVDLFRLWFEAGIRREESRQEEAESIFGQVFSKHGRERLMYTLTADGQQLRVWYGLPGRMIPDHVDSCGRNLLFGVYGHTEVVEKYLRAFLEIFEREEIRVPNGVRLYMDWQMY